MPDFLLPDLGEGLEDAEVVRWRVAVGDAVEVDQVVAEVETAKAVVEVPVPWAGVVTALHAEEGAVLGVGSPLVSVGEQRPERQGVQEPGVESGAVLVGYGTATSPRRARRSRRRPEPVALAPAAPVESWPERVQVVSPLVRRIARDAGLDLASLRGTGPDGIVRRADVEKALAERAAAATPAPAPVPAAPTPDEDVTRVPLRGARRAIAEKLSRSRREIPEATVWVDVDATDLVAAKAALTARAPEQPVGLLTLLARFALLGLKRYPELGGRVTEDEIVVPHHVHLGFAAQTDRGLVVPVVRDAHRLTTRELAAALAERTRAARAGALAPSDLTGGTFTVNNYGVFGIDGSAAIINHPEVAILGMGRVVERPWVVDGQLAVRTVTQLTLAFDHRVCDGGTAGGFLRYVADCVESPLTALGDL
ncbi:dihydrolipoamide acetyltransferase family protein [Vallicoccus soli]|uniref:Dihydrolipoamide acetyltransferase component of pyruvate dehydrogenase complex n=1 Tax=Vallicoccus soli TaxID=2339232 RepID=A0A3A3Z0F5_9ACTN|nr:dihydrolipoamide acetyltransferase family protein [Vallicoccus soli]RJK95981.1 2-oxo acid dehydrogenase subunit E2 [Vallicoccus soli]